MSIKNEEQEGINTQHHHQNVAGTMNTPLQQMKWNGQNKLGKKKWTAKNRAHSRFKNQSNGSLVFCFGFWFRIRTYEIMYEMFNRPSTSVYILCVSVVYVNLNTTVYIYVACLCSMHTYVVHVAGLMAGWLWINEQNKTYGNEREHHLCGVRSKCWCELCFFFSFAFTWS